jgi:hypothetical protein
MNIPKGRLLGLFATRGRFPKSGDALIIREAHKPGRDSALRPDGETRQHGSPASQCLQGFPLPRQDQTRLGWFRAERGDL